MLPCFIKIATLSCLNVYRKERFGPIFFSSGTKALEESSEDAKRAISQDLITLGPQEVAPDLTDKSVLYTMYHGDETEDEDSIQKSPNLL